MPLARDIYDLGRRLLLQTDDPVQPVVDPPPPPLQEGDRLELWVNRDVGNEEVDATVLRVSDNAYWIFDDQYAPDMDDLDAAVAEFESNVWPSVTGTFGSIWTPGVDSDPRLVIFHSRLRSGVGGYYSGVDEYPRSIQPFSNEKEMIYISADSWDIGSRGYMGVLAHELQHAVHWNLDPGEDSWLNEGMSEVAAGLAGYGVSSIGSFLQRPHTSLTEWAPDIFVASPNYGAAALFVEYLSEHYGGADLLGELAAEDADGMESVDVVLERLGHSATFLDVFRDWTVASYLDETDGRYSYSSRNLRSGQRIFSEFIVTEDTIEAAVPQFGANYYVLSLGSDDVTVEFTGEIAAELFPSPPYSGESCWWGNAGDSIDTHITRAVDLREVDSATLEYRVWHAIEDEWDYAYVMASTDGGETWEVLPTMYTTDDNPNGTAYGPGLTGDSGGWVRDTVDLGGYAGQEFLLRFEYITDDAIHDRGACFDDFAIPEIGWSDDTETAGDWIAAGFARVNNRIPQDYLVQVIREPDNGPATVTRLAVDANGTGSLDIEDIATGERVAIVVSAITREAAGSADYTLDISTAR